MLLLCQLSAEGAPLDPSSHPPDNQLVLLDWDTCGQTRKDGVIMGVEALDSILLVDCILLELPIVQILPNHQDH